MTNQTNPRTWAEQQKPVYTSFDDLMAAMKATARTENRVAGLSAIPDYTRKPTASQDPESLHARIFKAVRDQGPIFVEDVVAIVGVKPRQVYNVVNKAKELAQREGFDWCVEDVRFADKCKRRYWLEQVK